MKRRLLVLLLVLAAFASCRKQVADFEYPDFEATPTLNAILAEGKPVWAQVSLTQRLDSIHPAICSDAEVLLFVDGQFAERLQFDAGTQLYHGQTRPECGRQYGCKVIVPGHDTLSAFTVMPERPIYKSLEIIENAIVNDEGEACPAFLLTFKADPMQRLYYQASIWTDLASCDGKCRYSYHGTMHSSYNADDPVLMNEGSEMLVFSNELIHDSIYTMKINGYFTNQSWSYGGNMESEIEPLHGKIVVHMEGLCESYYRYLKSYYSHFEIDGYSNLFIGTIAPVNHYGNVDNGLGIFGGCASFTSDTIFYNMEGI